MTATDHVRQWWKHGVVYQIYPASFCDSNGDGIGDLAGITSKLDYIRDLGATIIWICPMYDSPQVDMGYDISNYEDVYRPYGTVADMEHLIREAHARDMKVMLDLVINHTSDQHAWFKESRSSKDNAKRDWYMWRPAKYDDQGNRLPPNNWRSNFGGGSAWKWDEATEEYYLHLFCDEQPDLNWENDECRAAIYETSMHFWLRRGVDGFRIDTVNMYSKPPGLPDAPVIDDKSFYQPGHYLYCNGPRMHEFLSEMNAILASYGAITVGELPATPTREKVLKYVSAEAKQLDMVFQFEIVDVGFGRAHRYDTKPRNFVLGDVKKAVAFTQDLIRGTDAWTTVFTENHDQARSVSRFADDSPQHRVASARMLALVQCALSGTQYVYQGQEIGMVNAPLETYPMEEYKDVDSNLFLSMIRERNGADSPEMANAVATMAYLARDHSRIPIPWDGRLKHGGFSSPAEKAGKEIQNPWMKAHPLAAEIDVASQVDDPASPLSFWRKMLRLRKEHADLLVYGDYSSLRMKDEKTMSFLKLAHGGASKALVVASFSTEAEKWPAPGAEELGLPTDAKFELVPVVSTHDIKDAGSDTLAPFEGRVYLVKY
ncbi:hypothetical protein N3K66_004554 [Trichothecium roseum]|uniref:Uncharacterized protein n=1 Tax=Trichothecium roseum TaxID=47278 RepID=A0ACC0V1P5_9HYPO|nr:hypothetical protein N3K66_004554 [Trichothecium roseum]